MLCLGFLHVNSYSFVVGKLRGYPTFPLHSFRFASTSIDMSRLTRQIVAIIQNSAQGNVHWGILLVSVGHSLRVPRCVSQHADLGGSFGYLQSFSRALEFALFPHALRRLWAQALCIKSKFLPCERVAQQVRGFLPGPSDKIILAF